MDPPAEPRPPARPSPAASGFWQATAINITQIVGAGVFATIPLILGVLPGRVRPAGVARRRRADPRRQHGLGRTRRRAAGGRRVVPLPARKLRPVALGPADGVPVRLADPHQRAARSRLRPRRRGAVLDRHRPRLQGSSTRAHTGRARSRDRRRPEESASRSARRGSSGSRSAC